MALVLDTGPLLAALDRADPDHAACAALVGDADQDLIVPALVLGELDYWCQRRLAPEVWVAFLEDLLAGAYRFEAPTKQDLARSLELQRAYRDMPIGVVDTTVLALVERLGEPKLATLDHRHFAALRPAHVDALRLLPA